MEAGGHQSGNAPGLMAFFNLITPSNGHISPRWSYGSSIGEHFEVWFVGQPPIRESNFWSFLPGSASCDAPDVRMQSSCSIYDPGHTSVDKYIFEVELRAEEIKKNCKYFYMRWKAWQRSKVNPLNPLTASGGASGPSWPVKGKVSIDAGEAGDWYGDFAVQVCCEKGKEGCGPHCDLISPV